jgi:hypothetical protein
MAKTGNDSKKTELLPPMTGVEITWARTGKFSEKMPTTDAYVEAEQAWKRILDRSESKGEKDYVTKAQASMASSLRNLHTIYKARELNFEENGQMREAVLKHAKERLAFGDKAADIVKSLPTMAIGGAGGITLGQILSQYGVLEQFQDSIMWALGVLCAGIAYLINVQGVKRWHEREMDNYVQQDYERNNYYEQYVTKSKGILKSLYKDLDRMHRDEFGNGYPQAEDVEEAIAKHIAGTRCVYLHQHMKEGKITSKLWPRCESGDKEATENCPKWPGKE